MYWFSSIFCRVIEELLGTIRGQIGSLYKLKEMICQLDVVVSFAQVSSGVGFCRPIFGQAMLIRDGRHPVLNRFSPDDLASNDTVIEIVNSFSLSYLKWLHPFVLFFYFLFPEGNEGGMQFPCHHGSQHERKKHLHPPSDALANNGPSKSIWSGRAWLEEQSANERALNAVRREQ